MAGCLGHFIQYKHILVFKFEQSSYLFSLKNSRPCRDLNPGPPWYQADMLSIELSWLGQAQISSHFIPESSWLLYGYCICAVFVLLLYLQETFYRFVTELFLLLSFLFPRNKTEYVYRNFILSQSLFKSTFKLQDVLL